MLFASHSSHPDPSLVDTFSDFKVNITQVSMAFFETGFFRFFFSLFYRYFESKSMHCSTVFCREKDN